MKFRTISIVQDTYEWHRWRADGIGASDAVVIDGWTKYKTLEQLIEEKVHRRIQPVTDSAALQGKRDEPAARLALQRHLGTNLTVPTCVESTTYGWLRASLDCANFVQNFVCEIKCGEAQFLQHQGTRSVAPWISIQVQHALAVTGFEYGYLWFWNSHLGAIKRTVKRNQRVINKLIDAEQEVWFEVERRRKLQSPQISCAIRP